MQTHLELPLRTLGQFMKLHPLASPKWTARLCDLEATLIRLGIDPRHGAEGFRSGNEFVVAATSQSIGWPIIPIHARSKRPAIKWKGKATTDPRELVRWQRFLQSSYGFALGNGYVLIDTDGPLGGESWKRFQADYGEAPETVEVTTGRDEFSRHLIYRIPDGEADLRNGANVLGFDKLDLRGAGGLAVLPPTMHRSGKRYRFSDGHAPDEIEIAVMPEAHYDAFADRVMIGGATSRQRTSQGPRVKRTHGSASRLFGDEVGFGGFQMPAYLNAIEYFFRAGVDAPAEPIISAMREMILDAPKDHGRSVERYMDGPDLPRQVERGRQFVSNVKEQEIDEYEYELSRFGSGGGKGVCRG